jgi:hypothetical protein
MQGTIHGKSGFYESWDHEMGQAVRAQFHVSEDGDWTLVGNEDGVTDEEQPAHSHSFAGAAAGGGVNELQWELPVRYADKVLVELPMEVFTEEGIVSRIGAAVYEDGDGERDGLFSAGDGSEAVANVQLTVDDAATVLQSKARQGRAMRVADWQRKQLGAATVLQAKARQGKAIRSVQKKRERFHSLVQHSEIIFDALDVQKKGVITKEDYERLWVKYYMEQIEETTQQQPNTSSCKLSNEQMYQISAQWSKIDSNSVGKATREEFVELQTRAFLHTDAERAFALAKKAEELFCDDHTVGEATRIQKKNTVGGEIRQRHDLCSQNSLQRMSAAQQQKLIDAASPDRISKRRLGK